MNPAPSGLFDLAAALEIRPLASLAEFRSCVAIQEEVWGPGFVDVVSASVLQVTSRIGGIVLGAFTPTGSLVGFVAGFTGIEDGRPIHWSHMLGVRDAAQNAGVGRMLKEHQRAELVRMGISEMRWTFDPLVAKNAHFNLNRLGARVVRYVRDMYGNMGSALHGTITDRIIVACPAAKGEVVSTTPRIANSTAPILTTAVSGDNQELPHASSLPPAIWIEVPSDIATVMKDSPKLALVWRLAVRLHFEWALGSGYVVTGLHRDGASSRTFYVLQLDPAGR